jgi:glycosyltransferase involved in cell wall biosynthesis
MRIAMEDNNPMSQRTKVVVLFDNLGPYHKARLDSIEPLFDLTVIECARTSSDYSWKRSDSFSFRLATLFTEGTSKTIDPRELDRRLVSLLEEIRPDVIAIPGWYYRIALRALEWALKNDVSTFVLSESTQKDASRSVFREWIKRRIVQCYNAGFVGGQSSKEYLQSLGMQIGKIAEGYDVVDNKYFKNRSIDLRSRSVQLQERYSLPKNYFLTVCRFVSKKNLFTLLDAYEAYHKECKDQAWGLVLCGDGEQRKELEARIKIMNLESHVTITGFRQYDEIPVFYSLAKAFFLVSTTEQWGLVVNEAMASGLPVVVSRNCGCAADLVNEGGNGYLVDPNDIESITNRMKQISTASELDLHRMGELSNSIIEEWGLERFADGFSKAIGCSLQEPRRRNFFLSRCILNVTLYSLLGSRNRLSS